MGAGAGGQGRVSAKGVTSGALLVIDREGLLGPPPKPSAAAPHVVSSYRYALSGFPIRSSARPHAGPAHFWSPP